MADNTTDPAARSAFIAGFRALADFLEAHPALPVPRYSLFDGLNLYPSGSDADKRAEVDRIAKVLDVVPEDRGNYKASRMFSGPVAYRIIAVPAEDDTAGEA